MAGGLEKLFFQIGLIDNLSGPAKGVMKQINSIQKMTDSGFSKILKGGVGLAAVGYTIDKLVTPALEDMKASAQIRSLGVLDKDLKNLEKTANSFALEFGVDDDAFVMSAANIKKSMPWISEGLAEYTRNVNLLAKATGSDADMTASYVGKMTNLFDDLAKKTGEKQWGEALIGMTAEASRIFNTDVNSISEGFTKIGTTGVKAGVSLSEQFAVIGSLQNLGWDGKKLGSYATLLEDLSRSGEKMGMSFTDSKGAALPLFEIIGKLRDKFGETLDTTEVQALNKAFGSGADVIVAMYNKTDKLQESIGKLNASSKGGMATAAEMAKANTTPIERAITGINQLREAFSYAALSAVSPFIDTFAKMTAKVTSFVGEHPMISKAIGVVITGIIGITAALSVFSIAMGAVRYVQAAIGTFKLITTAIKGWAVVQWALNTALWANPIGMVILGVAALVGVITGLFYWYDDLEKALSTSTWGVILLTMIDIVLAPFRMLWDIVMGFYNLITGNWGEMPWVQGILSAVESIVGALRYMYDILGTVKNAAGNALDYASEKVSGAWDGVKEYSGYNWIKDQLGLGGEEGSVAAAPQVKDLEKSRTLDVPAGGVINNSSASNTTNYGGVKIYSSKAFSPADLEEWQMLHAGV